MSKLLVDNPFVIGKYISDDYFCDREKETEFLYKQIVNGRNVAMLSPRRMGKTGLIYHLFGQKEVAQRYHVFFTDIYATQTIEEFVYSLSSAIYVGQRKSLKKRFWDLVKSLRLAFRTDAVTGEPELSLSLGDIKEPEKTLDEIFEYLESADKPCIVAIDEFQQIGEMPDTLTIQKRLRGIWQHQRNVSYCLFGSKKHLMTKLFQNRKMPFFQFGEMMYLDKIPTADWVAYICSRFERQGKHISEELAKRICETVEGNSSYVQQLAWNVLAETEQTTTEEDFCRGVDALLAQCSALFEEQLKGLTGYQLNFIRALCDGVTSDFGSKAILESYNLGSKSNISRIKASLQDKEMIDFDKNTVYLEDPVFKIWYKRNK